MHCSMVVPPTEGESLLVNERLITEFGLSLGLGVGIRIDKAGVRVNPASGVNQVRCLVLLILRKGEVRVRVIMTIAGREGHR